MDNLFGEFGWMIVPLAMSMVLATMQGYLGLHIVRRKVIFVDLALAQVAALGTVVAVYFGLGHGHEEEGIVSYAASLLFTFLGAALFAITRARKERVPQEAFIGIVYAVASGAAILLLAKTGGEAEHLKSMLVGNILLVSWHDVLKTAILFSAIGFLHWLWRKPFFMLSDDPEGAYASGLRVRLWDFLFYSTFGIVITSAVAVAGVLLVFCYLVVPAVCAVLLSDRTRPQLFIAWLVGVLASALGMYLSYSGDLPTGPSIVVSLGALLLLSILISRLKP